ncbi:MAG: hypothetical protein AAFP82_13175, partial [Bacteroidota bacterium]
MRNLIILLFLCLVQLSFAQIKGNGQLITKTFSVEDIESVEIHLYADVTVDCAAATESLEITAEENLMPYIARSLDSKRLTLGQKEWIQPKERIQIKIGA